MLGLFIVIFSTLSLVWYIKTNSHPKDFPPGPRLPLPLIGDGYVLGKDFNLGFTKLISKYGKNVGLWLGSNRTVVISDFDTLKDILNLNETSDRGGMVETEVEGKLLAWWWFFSDLGLLLRIAKVRNAYFIVAILT